MIRRAVDATPWTIAPAVSPLAAQRSWMRLSRNTWSLARTDAEPDASAARREAVDVVFEALIRSLGVAVGEHLGYLLTGAWTTLTGIALT